MNVLKLGSPVFCLFYFTIYGRSPAFTHQHFWKKCSKVKYVKVNNRHTFSKVITVLETLKLFWHLIHILAISSYTFHLNMKPTSLKLLVVHQWFLCFNFIKHVRTYLRVVNNISISLIIHFYKTTRTWCNKVFKENSTNCLATLLNLY